MRWSLRDCSAADEEFLVAVYASTRADELALTGWSAPEQDAFVRSQFAAQAAHYARCFPAHRTEIIVVDGQDAGRLIMNRDGGPDLHLMDIALLPAVRGAGIGTEVLQSLLHEAAQAGRPMMLHVEFNNPARLLYGRLGFVEVEDLDLYRRMRWHPPALAQAA